jgi:kynureninase
MTTATQPLLRDHFPSLAHTTYLVSHSMGAAPAAARDALNAYMDEWIADGPEAWERWLPRIARIADGIGAIIGAPSGSVFLAPNVALTQAAIASSLDFDAPRNEVVIEELQFPSLLYLWKEWERYGARLRIVPSPDGRTIPTEALLDAVTERTALVVLSHAYYVSGALCDVRAVQRRARETGALLCVDAYQTTGIYPYDVTEWDLDLVVGGSHKWLCGGPGCGFLYVRPALLERFRPAVTGWMAHERPFGFAPPPIDYARSMYRFGHGTPTIPGYVVAEAGHAIVRELGVARIRDHNVRLTQRLIAGALDRGLTVATPHDPEHRTGWVGIDLPDAERIYRALVERRVLVDYRPGCGIRVGPHFYSSDDDIDRFFVELDRLRRG